MKQKRETNQSREKKKASTVQLVIVGALVVAAAGVAVALSVSSEDLSPPPTAPSGTGLVSAPSTGGEVPAPPGVTNPAPYQYHAATNRHYDPFHAHWHAGPPPAEGNRVASSGTAVPAPPGITNPTPYQYDPATDSHYDPQHAHWHSGPPPR